MNEKELLEKIDSEHTAIIFSELYGESEIDTERRRYKKLITEISRSTAEDFFETGLCKTSENLRIFIAPGRTEMAGNHTDHNCGKVLAASIQLDNVAIVQPRNDNIIFFRSTGFPDVKVKLTDSNGAPDLQPKPEEHGTTESLVRGIAARLNSQGSSIGGFSANADSTVFPGSGLSSSAAVEVLICRIFDTLYNEGKRSPLEIAQVGQFSENVYFGKPCGLMDQIACAAGGAVSIDFADAVHPEIKRINFDFASADYALCIVNTGGGHANLTGDYASIPAEMKKVASFFGKSVLGELKKETILSCAAEIRETLGDRTLLRSLHFFDENARVDAMTSVLEERENASTGAMKHNTLKSYLDIVNESGDSSWELLQNVYSPHNHQAQGISIALALTKSFFKKQKISGACRVHGGGFAGTIQAYLPLEAISAYRKYIEKVFGEGSLTILRIKNKGASELIL
jgi:galactokinase